MKHRSALFLVTCVACAQPSPASIPTEPVWHLETAMAPIQGEIGPAAQTYLHEADLGLSSEDDWEVLSAITGADTLRHVRLQQAHRGLPVLGSEIAVHADDTTFLGYGGTVTRNLEGFGVASQLSAERALEAAAVDHAALVAAPAPIEYTKESSRLAIQPGDGEGATLVWQIELRNPGQDGVPPGRWFYFIDAATGEVVGRYDGLATDAQASGPGGNPKAPRSWVAALDVGSVGGQYAMETRRLATLDMKNEKRGGEVVRGPLDPIGDAAINDAHGFAEVTLAMMRDWMNLNSINDAGLQIVSRVHYDDGLGNAFWDGESVTYGDGGEFFYPLSGSLDVVAHEINHGFTEFHSDLKYRGASGAMNESFSDVAGVVAEYYFDPATADFTIGEDVFEGAALRYLCDPQADLQSIDHASEYEGLMDVHFASGIGNKAFCLAVARQLATGATPADAVRGMGRVWFLANAGYWTSTASFSQGCQGTVDAARALGLPQETVAAIQQSWADVGAHCESGIAAACNSDNLCELIDGETCYSCATDCGSCTDACSWWKTSKCGFGFGDCSRCELGASPCGDGVCSDDESDETCGQDCGCRAPGDSCGTLAPYGCWCDADCEQSNDCCADVGICR
jgi:vibriolysin